MRRFILGLLAAALITAGCSAGSAGGVPKAVTAESQFDFGNVPVTAAEKTHDFVIKNEGTGDLKLSAAKVKLLEGC